MKRTDASKIVEKAFHKCKSAGYKKLHQRTADGYVGLSKRDVLKCIKNNDKLKRFNIKFTNKAKPRPVAVKRIQEQHQIDLVDMKNMQTEHNGKPYRYIFSLMDIFSRFHWLAPLERKKSSHVKKELRRIYKVHGIPERLQSDNGGEFRKDVQKYCKTNKIKMIRCRPYNPKAQGKVERSHRVLRNKIHYDMVQQRKTGVNWVKNLPNYMKCLNNEKREELSWKSPFEIYFGRKDNELTNDGKKFDSNIEVMATTCPNSKQYSRQAKQTSNWRKSAKKADERMSKRMLEKHKRQNVYKTYRAGENVFVRVGKKGANFLKNS